MDRPKHRRFTLLGIALLAGGALLLLARQWTSESEPLALPANAPTQQAPAPSIDPVAPATPIETTERTAPTTQATRATAAAGFRGRIIDAVTRQPVSEFEVKLVRAHSYSEEEPITRSFKSK